jgi:exodeoxyribonuclease V
MQLSTQQQEAYSLITDWLSDTSRKRFVLAGYAGTGKSFLASILSAELSSVHFCAFTGKAAEVLRSRGCHGATTIHGAIYKPVKNSFGGTDFVLDYDGAITRNVKLVIVDEYSMLSEQLISDLESVSRKVLYLGDNFQLPPVNGTCNLVPDYQLTEVHRQALDSGILRAATDLRTNGFITPEDYAGCDDILFLRKSDTTPETYLEADQIICQYNNTRQNINRWFRQKKGYTSPFPIKGEPLICLKNNHEIGLCNGGISEAQSTVTAEIDDFSYGIKYQSMKLDVLSCDVLMKAPPKKFYRTFERLDYSYACTAHKCQGSEWNNVLICDEGGNAQWKYTSLTRSKNKVTIVK